MITTLRFGMKNVKNFSKNPIVFSFPIRAFRFHLLLHNPFIKPSIDIHFRWEWLIFRSLTFNANCLKWNHLQINTFESSQTLIPGLKRMNTNNKTNGESWESDKSINVGWKVENIVWRTNGLWTDYSGRAFSFSSFRLLFIHSFTQFILILTSVFCFFVVVFMCCWTQWSTATAWNLNRTRTHFVDAHIVRITWEPIVCSYDCRFFFVFNPSCIPTHSFFLCFPMKSLELWGRKKMRLFCNTTYLQSDTRNVSFQCKQWTVFAWKYFVVNHHEEKSPEKPNRTRIKKHF